MLASEIFSIIRHFEHNFPLFSEKSTDSINFTFGQKFCSTKLPIITHTTGKFLGPRSILFCLFIITPMRPVGPKGSDPGLRTLSAGLNACAFAVISSVTQFGVVVRQFRCLNYWHNFRSIRAMRVAYCFTFASTTYQSLVLENRRENGERMESNSDY